MAASDHAQPISRRDDALAIVRRLVGAGHVAYFAGGCVRDALLGLEPKDYDVATAATPEEIRRLFPRSQGVGQAFGVLLVREGRSQIELATFRADGDYTDGRRPDDVRFAGPDEDARRRDFTINGLFYDPLADRVIDLVGGVADLERRTLRAIGDPAQRFGEDYLRLLRAVRFAARFDLTIEPATRDAIRRHADRLPRIAPERIADELRAILVPPTRLRAQRLLDDLRLTPALLRWALAPDAPASLAGPPGILAALPGEPSSFALALFAWAFDALPDDGTTLSDLLAPSPLAQFEREVRRTLKLSNDELANLRAVSSGSRLLVGPPPTVATLKRFLAQPFAADARKLLAALGRVGHSPARIDVILRAAEAFPQDEIAPPPLVTGNDLVAAGHAPGPRFKPALDAAYDAQLEGRVTTAAAALATAEAAMRGA